MLMTTKNLPVNNNNDFPWGSFIVAVLFIGGISIVGYNIMKPNYSPEKNKENEWR